ncbi:MAG TPA: calcium-binding EGF-like domain-containing protein, partial [Myxococcota bacterium]|nr:calcium-binding EGF-like domain-containing protein [Myxococcota bacterium]
AQPICTSACVNGTCTAPDTCTCTAGWDGATCADPICTSACVNGTCTAPDTCACAAGWDGATCAQFTCDPGCGDNASCTGPDTCTCDDGFEGDGHACTSANPCADQPDWTPCDAGACFAETCEPVGENDACEDAIGLEADVPVLATLAGFHAWWTEAPSCLDLPGGLVDAFYRFQGQAGVRYVVILTPAVDLDAALILRGACDVAGDGCIDGADDGGAGVPESVTLTPVADGPVLIQVTRRADSGVEFEIRVQVADDPGDDPGGDGVSADEAFADEAAPDATDPRDVPSSDVAWPEDPGVSDASDEDASGDDASGDDASREDAPGTDATVRDPGAGDDPGDDPDASVDAVTRDADPGVPDGDSRKRGGCVATPGRAAASGPMLLLLLAVWGVFARVRRRPT